MDLEGRIVAAIAAGDDRRVRELRADGAHTLRYTLSVNGWILMTEDGSTDSPTCPACIERVKVDRARATCPPWCTTDHAEEKLTIDWTFRHSGPDFGDVILCRWNDGPLSLRVADQGDIEFGPEDSLAEGVAYLRVLALHALAAADWLARLE